MASASSKNPSSSSPAESRGGPWWRHPWMYLVLGGPAVVVVAGIVTMVIAMHGADPVIGSGSAEPVKLQHATQGR